MAEAILNYKGRPTFTAYSAGSHPSGSVRPEALRQLETARIPAGNLARCVSDWTGVRLPNLAALESESPRHLTGAFSNPNPAPAVAACNQFQNGLFRPVG